MHSVKSVSILVTVWLQLTQVVATEPLRNDSHNALNTLLIKNPFRGVTYGLMTGDRLILADAQGHLRGHKAQATTLLPILDVSKLFTAVAILQLVEDRELKLDSRVFGNHGILYYMRGDPMDPRYHDITVEDLLYHRGGWDETKGPLYDPMLNAYYVRNGFNVIDIGREMEVYGILSQDDIIRFMVTQPLHFDPGTKWRQSNFGYCLLGRIIEEITEMSYEDYIKEYVLRPHGLWHTRIGPAYSDTYQAHLQSYQQPGRPPKLGYIPLDYSGPKSLFDVVPPMVLDSCLGWHSNIYDIARFCAALFQHDENSLLDADTVENFILSPGFSDDPRLGVWDGIGIGSNNEGVVWFQSHQSDIGVQLAFYHQGPKQRSDMGATVDATGFVVGVTAEKHPKLMSNMRKWVSTAANDDLYLYDDAILEDISDFDIEVGHYDMIVMQKIDEHRLEDYLTAIQVDGYVPVWLQGYNHGGRTRFVVVSKRVNFDDENDFLTVTRSSKKVIITDIAHAVRDGYQITFLHSYRSVSHDNNFVHFALLRKDSRREAVQFDISTDAEEYLRSVEEGFHEGYLPVVQSVDTEHKKIIVTYLLREKSQTRLTTKPTCHSDLTLEQLEMAVENNTIKGFVLIYLNTYIVNKKHWFSAVFVPNDENWSFKSGISSKNLQTEIENMGRSGLLPSIVVGYSSDASELNFVVVWRTSVDY